MNLTTRNKMKKSMMKKTMMKNTMMKTKKEKKEKKTIGTIKMNIQMRNGNKNRPFKTQKMKIRKVPVKKVVETMKGKKKQHWTTTMRKVHMKQLKTTMANLTRKFRRN